jgi:hypothetical protein
VDEFGDEVDHPEEGGEQEKEPNPKLYDEEGYPVHAGQVNDKGNRVIKLMTRNMVTTVPVGPRKTVKTRMTGATVIVPDDDGDAEEVTDEIASCMLASQTEISIDWSLDGSGVQTFQSRKMSKVVMCRRVK